MRHLIMITIRLVATSCRNCTHLGRAGRYVAEVRVECAAIIVSLDGRLTFRRRWHSGTLRGLALSCVGVEPCAAVSCATGSDLGAVRFTGSRRRTGSRGGFVIAAATNRNHCK